MIRSRFLSNEGIYVARISFDKLQTRSAGNHEPDRRRIYQAFWLDQPTESHPDPLIRRPPGASKTKEIDFEWTNVFSWRTGPNETWINRYHEGALTANVHTSKTDGTMHNQVGPLLMSCAYYTHEPEYMAVFDGCFVDELSVSSYIVGEGDPPRPVDSPAQVVSPSGNEFVDLVIKYSDVGVEFYGFISGYRDLPGTFWLGDYNGYYNWGDPVFVPRDEIWNLQDGVPMNIMFSIHADRFSPILDQDHRMVIDWVYYSDDPVLMSLPLVDARESIRSEVHTFLNSGYYQVNTVGLGAW